MPKNIGEQFFSTLSLTLGEGHIFGLCLLETQVCSIRREYKKYKAKPEKNRTETNQTHLSKPNLSKPNYLRKT